jgi:hypothetical protein
MLPGNGCSSGCIYQQKEQKECINGIPVGTEEMH